MTSNHTFTIGADSDQSRATLRGRPKVFVYVEEGDYEQFHLTPDQIHTDVEVKLRTAGIPVATKDDWLRLQSKFNLDVIGLGVKVDADTREGSPDSLLDSIRIQVFQFAHLDRKPRSEALAITWCDSSSRMVQRDSLGTVRDHIKDEVDHFLNAYLSANPKT